MPLNQQRRQLYPNYMINMLYIAKLGLNISKKILRGVHPTAEMISVHTT